MRDALSLVVVDVEHLSLRLVAGSGHQAELTIKTRHGALTLRLIGNRPLRLTDLRTRDKRQHARGRSVPFGDLVRP